MKEYFESIIDQIVDYFKGIDYAGFTIKIFIVLIGLAVIYLAFKLILLAITRFFSYKHRGNIHRKKTINKLMNSLVKYIKYIVMILYVLFFFNVSAATLLTGIGAIGIIVTFAFQDLIKDVVAGFFVLVENSYDVGDRVMINNVSGVVENLSLKTTTIVPYTGEKVIFNNSSITTVTNYTSVGYAVIINTFKVHSNTNIVELIANLEKEIKGWYEKFPNALEITVKGVNSIIDNGYLIEVNSKVLPLTQFQTNRDINLELINFTRKYNYTIPYNTISVVKDEKLNGNKA